MIQLARKKVVFIIVEGPSDDEALGMLFCKIFDNNSVYVDVMHKDITTDRGVKPENILAKLGNEVRKYAKANHFTNQDFQEIIHIVDMDGAYVPDKCIVENSTITKTVYSTSNILTSSVSNILSRNEQKRNNLNKLCLCSKLWNIPYRIFYMSCNLDHVLHNKLNIPDIEKENSAHEFAAYYRSNVEEFKHFMLDSDFSVVAGYKESWELIKSGIESLQRHTNVGLCFPAD
ncbi:MAG: hypothetical protein ACI37J_08100 [Candidatus Bruticola sp.]